MKNADVIAAQDFNKTAIITGAHGFIGRHIAYYLSKQGWKIIGIGHGNWASLKDQEQWGVSEWHSSNVTAEALCGCSVVPNVLIHCAGSGSVSYSLENPKADFERNVDTTLNVLEYARMHAPTAKIVVLSSAAVYGSVQHFPIIESEPLNPVSPYGVNKKIAEELCLSYSRHFNLAVVVLRLFSVYGIGLRKQLLWEACNKIMQGNLMFFGTGLELRDWIHIQDVVKLVEVSIDFAASSMCRIINGGSGIGVSVQEILNQLIIGLGSSVSPVFSSTEKMGDPSHYIADISQAVNMNWQPNIHWRNGVLKYGEWFRKGAL